MAVLMYILVLLVVVYLLAGIRVLRPTEKGVIERLGRYKCYKSAGFVWIAIFFERLIKINITERLADILPQDIITKDNLNARVDLMVYYKVRQDELNIKKSLYNVNDFKTQVIALAQTTARNVIGGMMFTDVNSKRNLLNVQLAEILDKQSDAWGVEIVRVEMKEITPPRDVQDTMNKVIKAQNEKDAAIDFATSVETRADGEKRARIKEAEGVKQSTILKAEGEAKAFDLINKSFKGNAQLLKRLEVTQASLENNSKIVLTEKGITPQIIMGSIPVKIKDKED